MAESTARPNTDKPVDLSPTSLMGKPMAPNYSMKHVAQTLKGADIQIHHTPNAGLRTKQNQAVRMFIEEQRTALYLLARRAEITENEFSAQTGELDRIQTHMLETMADWAGSLDPRQGVTGSGFSREFEIVVRRAFNESKDVVGAKVKIAIVPTGPVTGQDREEEEIEVPVNLKLSDLDAVEPTQSGPLYEQSVLEAGLQQPDLPVYDPDESVKIKLSEPEDDDAD
jgi:hypothetical protein